MVNNSKFRFVSDSIVSEVEKKLARLSGQNEACIFKSFLHKRFEKMLKDEANYHSFKIENPGMSGTTYDLHASGKGLKKGVKCLERAFSYAVSNCDSEKLNTDVIRRIATIVEPSLEQENGGAKFRTAMVRAGNSEFTPPYPHKVGPEMDEFVHDLVFYLDHKNVANTLEASAYAHLHLARIHPFFDGNGRTSRVLQNAILVSNGLPPAVIYPGERSEYFSLIDGAHLSWRSRTGGTQKEFYDPEAERKFYNFIAGKVSSSLDRLLER